MTESKSKDQKAPRKDVDTLLSEVTSAAHVKPRVQKKVGDAPRPEAPAAARPVPPEPAQPKDIRIRQIRSGICTPSDQKQALRGLGLRRIRHEVVRQDTPSTRGQILKVRHLVEVVSE
jgi:large subunit ribosomal protein L30